MTNIQQRIFTGILCALLLCGQVFANPMMRCDMDSMTVSMPAMDHGEMDHDSMHLENDPVSSSMLMADCCDGNCNCPDGTGFANGLVAQSFLFNYSAYSKGQFSQHFLALEAHPSSSIRPPIIS
ncbi:hypothetical protein [Aliiglaciecola sp. LCG003]|uniref:hypothetical protein n=1 Tax=Aliiglaciecola sp. LCG003 TaxID=3053655 RepID=UPI0025725D2B|nr:hypothetical protein [Aliiglaciecola sp. LCG003]WJG09614.1 hypothetical protein QR722_00835 [Aliiglaciecola sp. LCG003]